MRRSPRSGRQSRLGCRRSANGELSTSSAADSPDRGLTASCLQAAPTARLVRADGVTELDALYEMQTDDGAIFTVNNRVLVDPNAPAAPRFSKISIQAPDGPYAWLNRLVIIGTLASLRPQREAVLIRAFKLA